MAKAGDGGPRSNRRRATRRLCRRVTPEAEDRFKTRAAAAGFENAQDYLSAFIDGDVRLHTATRKVLIRAVGELGKIGSNVNQIAKAVNEGRMRSIDAHSAGVLDTLREKIEELGEEIRQALR